MFGRNQQDNQPQAARPQAGASQPQSAAAVTRADVNAMLVEGEVVQAFLDTDNRGIAVTNRRVFLLEDRGSYSVIAGSSVDAFEVSDAGDGMFVKIFFGGGLNRTLKVRSSADAAALTAIAAHRG